MRLPLREQVQLSSSDKIFFEATPTKRDFLDVATNELLEREWDNEILFFGRFQLGRTLTGI